MKFIKTNLNKYYENREWVWGYRENEDMRAVSLAQINDYQSTMAWRNSFCREP
jgi:hypothetical protein